MSVKTTASLGGATVAAASLPFTGFPLWAVALAGLGLIAFGFGARRFTRARTVA